LLLRTPASEHVEHYHRERNHQGLANELIEPTANSKHAGTVVRDSRLGGLLNHYRRAA
jgi:putative transposase